MSRAASCSSGSTSRARSTRASCSGCSASRWRSRARSCSTTAASDAAPAEVQAALADLRTALTRPLGHASRPTAVTFAEELGRRARAVPGPRDSRSTGDAEEVPGAPRGAGAVGSRRGGAQRAQARARSARQRLAAQDGGTFVLEVRNDGAPERARRARWRGPAAGTLEALQHGGVLEYGESEPGAWQVRLVVPTGSERGAAIRATARACQNDARRGAAGQRESVCACSSSTTTTSCTGASG